MNNVTLKQIIILLLMTSVMALILAIMPEQPASIEQRDTNTNLIKQASK